jgi:large subunit ribosomal protein L24
MLGSQISRGFAKYQKTFKNWRIVKGDNIMVNSGKDKGKIGQVLKVFRKTNQILVDGVNMRFKEVKQDDNGMEKRGLMPKISPIHVSNANHVDPETGNSTKVRFGFLNDGTKVRISKTSNQIIPKPNRDFLTYESRHQNKKDGPQDTSSRLATSVTYLGEDFNSIRLEFESYIAEKERLESLLVFDK